MKPAVLHVVEAMGGGVSAVLEDYIRHTPSFAHHVLSARRPGHDIADSVEGLATTFVVMQRGHLRRVRQVRRLLVQLNPQVIHGHSSLGGVYARLASIGLSVRVVYTPHCFAFERRDVSLPARAAFFAAELALSPLTDVLAGVSLREAALARRFLRPKTVVHIPNVVAPSIADVRAQLSHPDAERPLTLRPTTQVMVRPRLVAGTIGRVSRQKGVDFFLDAVCVARTRHPDIQWVWIGGGSRDDEQRLRQAGVKVTGWCERAEAIRSLWSLDVYVHTAAWEGAPLSILEAAALGKPVVARELRALEGQPVGIRVRTPGELAEAVSALGDEDTRCTALAAMAKYSSRLTPRVQTERLEAAYHHSSLEG